MKEFRAGARVLFLFLIFIFIFSASGVNAENFKFTYSIFFPASHDQYKTAEAWAREVEKQSLEKIKITMFPGGTLSRAKNCYEGVVNNISDIGMSCFAYTRGRFPVMESCDLPLGYPDGKTASKTVNDFFREVRPKELKEVKVLYIHAHGPGLLHTLRPVETLDDFRKMKIRSTGLSAKVVKALGGIPVAMSQGATYESLKKGIVEGSFGPVEVLKGWRQAEVIKSTTDTSNIGYTTTMFVVMNKKKWAMLPDDLKKVIEQISDKWVETHGLAWDQSDFAGKKYSLELGNKYIKLSKDQKELWKKKVRPVIDEYISDSAEKGIDGRLNVDKLLGLISKNSSK